MNAKRELEKKIAVLEYILIGTLGKINARIMEEIANLKIDLASS